MTAITIRPAGPEDTTQILDVLRAALGETPLLRRTPELWAWKHHLNPFGESLVLVAEVGGTIVGVRAFMRWDLQTSTGETIRCVRAVDTATHPDHLRQGIFRRLTEAAVERARDEGIDLIFNTPNATSGAGYLKMGWQPVGDIGVIARIRLGRVAPVDPAEVPRLTDHVVDPSAVFPAPPARTGRGLRTPRDETYLRWRFDAHPTARYGAIRTGDGVAVVRANVRSGRRELVLSDVLGVVRPRLFREVARRSRSRYVATWFSPPAPERRIAARALYAPIPGLRTLTLMARPLTALPVDVTDLANWDLTVSDLELL